MFVPILVVVLSLGWGASRAAVSDASTVDNIHELFLAVLLGESLDVEADLERIDSVWQENMIPMVLEVLAYSRSRVLTETLTQILEKQTGQAHGRDIDAWYRWLWSRQERRHPHYAQFKSRLYKNMDPRFEHYFSDQHITSIRLDEVRWGGVVQDGIPPLRKPAMIKADQADYLADSDIVFGVALNGDVRAYPQRILAWHEMFVDEVDSTPYAGVYCTLCGMVVLYGTTFEDVEHDIGTSGFLYRSNKLMYDNATQSLWSTTRGEPVVGPLVGKNIRLEHSYVVTTTWGEWRRRHPQTQVLSLNTGHERNYGEGVAYKKYFATDKLMFSVPQTDNRLPNKTEVLALRFPEQTEKTAAITADYLLQNRVFHHQLGPQAVVVLTDPSGANRVYDPGGTEFVSYDGDQSVTDAQGQLWTLTESALTNTQGGTRKRLPAHRAFWFGWHAVYTDTELVM